MEDKQAMVDLVIQIQQLQDEVRMLRGMLEDQSMELENLGNRQRDQYLDLDQRITGYAVVHHPARWAPQGRFPSTQPPVPIDTPLPVGTGPAGISRRRTRCAARTLDTPSSVTAIATPDTQAREMAASPEAEKQAMTGHSSR